MKRYENAMTKITKSSKNSQEIENLHYSDKSLKSKYNFRYDNPVEKNFLQECSPQCTIDELFI